MKNFTLIVLMAIIGLLSVNAQIPTNGLVGYWPFNGNANDESGNGNNGTVNGATLTTDRFGNANSAYSFNGTSNYITVPHSSSLNFTSSYSVSLWFKINGNGPMSKTYWSLIDKNGTGMGYNDPYHLWIFRDNYSLCGRLGNGSNSSPQVWDSTSFYDNSWHSAIMVFNDIKDSVYLYTDGIPFDTVLYSDVITTNSNQIMIGNWVGYAGNYFNGKIDDIRLYNRALDVTEVSELYNEGIADNLSNGLVAMFPFNGNANDESGNGHDGVVNGATLTSDRFGNANRAYSFDGANDYISTLTNVSIGIERTVSFWAKLPNIYTSPGTLPVSLAGDFNISFGGWGFVLYNGVTSGWYGASSCINDQAWHFYTVISTTGNKIDTKFYQDGLLLTNIGFDLDFAHSTSNSQINFGNNLYGAQFYNGQLDDIRIYNRIITNAEISNLYNYSPCSNVETTLNPTICNGDSILLEGSYQFITGTYRDTLQTTLGCDSIIITNLTVNDISIGDTTAVACDSFTWYGIEYTSSATPTHILTNALGCDSIVTLNLTINSSYNVNDTTVFYVSDSNFELESPEIYFINTDNLSSSASCDSLVNRYKKYVFEANHCTDTTTILVNDTIWINDTLTTEVFDTTFVTIYDTLTTEVFDTTFVTIYDTLTTEVFDTTFVTIYDTLTTEVFDTTFVTVYDTLTTEIFDTTYVTVYDSITVTDTLIIDVTLTGVPEPNNINTLLIYPNPANEFVIINTGDYNLMSTYNLKIVNTLGQTVFENLINQQEFQIDVNSFGGYGTYFVNIYDDLGTLKESRKLILQ